ncbi:hypothetical protein [Chondromyces crocatus]|uniref:Chorismatase FkbO/Hyg5-like N-terminal domain-containing protein n=1 Tax=Chondromyces crocatus TaxID=52 RepID=A0A0K1EAD3_CHOCO|nr:hypothetical protein [Chondromyces crocatus]AKT37830.1 uncharacterized protein CMC5_019730 [Chondromyces crocatus]
MTLQPVHCASLNATRLRAIPARDTDLEILLALHEGHILRPTQFLAPGTPVRPGMEPVHIAPLGDRHHELLVTDTPVRSDHLEGVEVRFAADLCYFEVQRDDAADFATTAEAVYAHVFRVTRHLPDHRLLRLWNYLPSILRGDDEEERYRRFNVGRFAAWSQLGPCDAHGDPIYPAATAIGAYGGPLIVQVLLTRQTVDHVQNYRQRPPMAYSSKYGHRAPGFARGTLRRADRFIELLVSGTASIVGEETRHDRMRDQSEETLRNLRALLSRENLGDTAFDLGRFHSVRAYVKHPEDLPEAQRALERHIPPEHIIYLWDDICRPGLLLEVEGIAA